MGVSLLNLSVPIFESAPRAVEWDRLKSVPLFQLIDKFGAYRLQQVGLIMGQFQNPVHDARGGSCAVSSEQSRLDGPLLPNAPPAETARRKRCVPRLS